ncbi:hypothetical protein [Mangrovimonas xylaniphaga]|uniref:hypothetical protein n=1 Tax=Mangrovimonas xylaniphaga TaxID=1645915 RepID=UPI0006B4E830|nr:hypothetical protein [Mangrovimonas xylaniphaga]
MKCKLCLKEKPLCKKSHIVPRFLYKGMFYKGDNTLIKLNPITLEKERGKIRTGIYDKDILCESCENHIGKFEDYISNELFEGTKNYSKKSSITPIVGNNNLHKNLIKGLDYNHIKLFCLSIIWKAHHSKHEFFQNVDLGKYESQIRDMILNIDPKEENIFPFAWFYYPEKKISTKALVPVRKFRLNNISISYNLHINHHSIVYKISKDNNSSLDEFSPKKDNTFPIYSLQGKTAKTHFEKLVGLKYF